MANPLFDTLFGRHQGKATPFLEAPDGTIITHSEFLDLAAQYAHVLVESGVKPGDRVAVQIGKSPSSFGRLRGMCSGWDRVPTVEHGLHA
jgi:malonyl-CoA/methylmalonyl-CoA synthetase